MPLVRLVEGTAVRVATIYAVGRNFRSHAHELGSQVPEEPFFFIKAASSLWDGESPVVLPFARGPIHHEVEMVVLLERGGAHLDAAAARATIGAVAVGLDLTLRELQQKLKARGLPWAMSKSFTNAAVVSPFRPIGPEVDLGDLPLELSVNGQVRQSDRTSSQIWDVGALLAFLSERVPLVPGDALFCGTPSGVGPLAPGDELSMTLGEQAALSVRVVEGSPR